MKIVIYHLPTLSDSLADHVLSKFYTTVDGRATLEYLKPFTTRDKSLSFPVHTKLGLSHCSADVITRVVRRDERVKPSDTSTRPDTILGVYARQLCSKYLRKR